MRFFLYELYKKRLIEIKMQVNEAQTVYIEAVF